MGWRRAACDAPRASCDGNSTRQRNDQRPGRPEVWQPAFAVDCSEYSDEDEWSEEDEKTYADYRKRRLKNMGTKSDEYGDKAFVCAIERKVYPGATPVCDDCPGGCMAEKGMPGLLEVEGMVEYEFEVRSCEERSGEL